MKISIKKIIKILEDAERDFRKPPNVMIDNHSGLCFYIRSHKLIKHYSNFDKTEYIKKILGDYYSENSYTFCDNNSQDKVWRKNYPDMKYERAAWCKKRLEYFKGIK